MDSYDDGDFVRHVCKYLTSKVLDKQGRINCIVIEVPFGNQSVVDGRTFVLDGRSILAH